MALSLHREKGLLLKRSKLVILDHLRNASDYNFNLLILIKLLKFIFCKTLMENSSATALILISKLYQEGKITDDDREKLKGKLNLYIH